jgi:hypothetical protein
MAWGRCLIREEVGVERSWGRCSIKKEVAVYSYITHSNDSVSETYEEPKCREERDLIRQEPSTITVSTTEIRRLTTKIF